MNTAESMEGREIDTAESGTIALISKAEIDQQITTAKKYPRSLKRFRDEALQMVTLTESVAKECIYALPRKDANGQTKTIEGPSARFAEVIASAWGNCRAGARVVGESADFVTAQGVFYDLERNVAITYEAQRRITGSKGKRYSTDMIGVTANAACSIALRNAILKGVPKAFWSELYNATRKTIAGDVKTLTNRRADAIKEFAIFGVSEGQILAVLGKGGVQDIGVDDLVTLHGLLTAIRDGDSTPEEIFNQTEAAGSIGMPRAKSASAPTAPVQGGAASNGDQEASQQPAATTKTPPPAGGAQGAHLTPGMMKIVRARLEGAGITEEEMAKKFGAIDSISMANVNDVLAWISSPA